MHEKPRSIEELDQNALFPKIEISEQFLYQQEHLILGLSYALAKGAQAGREVRDRDVISVLSAMASSYETLTVSGLHYESPMPNVAHQAIAAELQTMVKEYRDAEQKHASYSRLRDSDVLRALVFLLRMAMSRTSGRPKSRAFMDFLFQQFPERQSTIATADEGNRIIVP